MVLLDKVRFFKKELRLDVDFDAQSAYTFEVLYVIALCLAKLSIVALLNMLFARQSYRYYVLGFGSFVLVSSLSLLFAVLFQCRVAEVWNFTSNQCIDLV